MMTLTRRSFFGWTAAVLGAVALATRLEGQGRGLVLAGEDQDLRGKVDPLADPGAIGRNREALDPLDNDPILIATERRLRCTCGCTLDIYTCRTTDFTCTFSPALHAEIRDLYRAGKSPDEIVSFMVDREGPQMLLAPPARGFNLAGYLVPGLSMAAAGTLLTAYLLSKRSPARITVNVAPNATPSSQADLERLRRALDEVES